MVRYAVRRGGFSLLPPPSAPTTTSPPSPPPSLPTYDAARTQGATTSTSARSPPLRRIRSISKLRAARQRPRASLPLTTTTTACARSRRSALVNGEFSIFSLFMSMLILRAQTTHTDARTRRLPDQAQHEATQRREEIWALRQPAAGASTVMHTWVRIFFPLACVVSVSGRLCLSVLSHGADLSSQFSIAVALVYAREYVANVPRVSFSSIFCPFRRPLRTSYTQLRASALLPARSTPCALDAAFQRRILLAPSCRHDASAPQDRCETLVSSICPSFVPT